MNFFERRSASEWIAAVLALVVFSVPMLPYLATTAKPADFAIHIAYARAIHQLSDIVSPHFLFQVILFAMNRLTGISLEAAAVLLMASCYACMAALIAFRVRNSNPSGSSWSGVAVAMPVLLASHIFLQTALKLNFYYGYIAPTVYHSPTQVLSKALALALMLAYFASAFDGRGGWAWRVFLPVSVVLSAVAKPSFLIAFLPCVFAVELYRGATDSWKAAFHNLCLVAPPAC